MRRCPAFCARSLPVLNAGVTLPWGNRRFAAAAFLLCVAAPLAGCKSEYDRAVEKARHDAAATGTAQQVVSVDDRGNTAVTVVEPPLSAGQPVGVASVTEPAGAALPSNLPDFSNGIRPAPGKTLTFVGPPAKLRASAGTGANAPANTAPLAPGAAPALAPTVPAPAVAPVVENATAAAQAQSSAASGSQSNTAANNEAAAQADTAPGDFVPTRVTLPAGTAIAIRLNQSLSVKHTHAGDRFTGVLAEPVRRNRSVVLPRGTHFSGVVTEAHRRGHFKGHSYLALRLTGMVYQGHSYPVVTTDTLRTRHGKGKRSAALISGGAGAGMLIGGLATGGVGLAVGALSGGGLGTLLAGLTGNRDLTIPAETVLRFRLEDSLAVQPED